MKDLFSLRGRTALVTGSSRGIGRAMALALAEFGADVAIHGSRPSPAADEVCGMIRAAGRRAAVVTGDLGAPGAARRIHDDVCRDLGAPDIVVHNASLEIRRPWRDIPADEYRRQMDVNFWAGLELFQASVGAMEAKGWGRLIVVGSVQQRKPHPDMLVYAASKMACREMVRGLAHQLAATGVTVNNIAPGAIHTDRTRDVLSNPDYRALVERQIPMGYVGEPDDCVGALLLLASDAGRYITGENLFVDGMKNY